jgi:hypothetical protein
VPIYEPYMIALHDSQRRCTYIGRVYSIASYKISYFVATSIYDNFIYYFTIMSVYIYDSWATITHEDIFHNVIVNHIVRSYYNLIN